ncbi:MAG: hypothetical protein ACI9EW_002090 [Cellvibrionaceae bacterium]|jgi:hypothetical protein
MICNYKDVRKIAYTGLEMINGAYVAVLFEQNLLVFGELPKLPKTILPYLEENRFSPDRHLYGYNDLSIPLKI